MVKGVLGDLHLFFV